MDRYLRLSDVLEWIGEHKQAWEDFCNRFNVDSDPDSLHIFDYWQELAINALGEYYEFTVNNGMQDIEHFRKSLGMTESELNAFLNGEYNNMKW